MKFFHVYNEDCFKGLEKNGFINKNTGFKIQNVFSVPEKRLFNNIAAKGGTLYNLIREGGFPFYVDRIAGGITYFPYSYDKSLLREYSELLGDWFLGVQLHETNNRRQNDWPLITRLLGHKGPYDLSQMKKLLKSDYAVTPDGTRLYALAHDPVEVYATLRYAEEPEEYFSEVRDMYLRRLSDTDGHILPCDGCQLFTHLQNELGMRTFMPEIGSQGTRIQQALATVRGMAKAYGKTWGAYYECWRSDPETMTSSMPCFNSDPVNEWYLTQDTHADDFTTYGENGGSSRLLQNRIYHYVLMSGADYLSEEWGLNCSYSDMSDFTLSSYGLLKRDFISSTEDICDVTAHIPFAIVLPKRYACAEIPTIDTEHKFLFNVYRDVYLDCRLSAEDKAYYGHVENVLKLFFARKEPYYGNEGHALCNTRFGDMFDVVYDDFPTDALRRYEYLIDATPDGSFARKNAGNDLRILESGDMEKLEAQINRLLRTVMPVCVNELPYLVSTDGNGRRYLSVFNNEGNLRSHEKGDTIDHAADRTVSAEFLAAAKPTIWKASSDAVNIQRTGDRKYSIHVPATEFVILTF